MGDASLLITDTERYRVPKYYLAAVSSWLGSVSLGTVIAYSAPSIPSIKSPSSPIHLSDDEISWFCSLMAIGAIVGSLFAGKSIEYIGRKGTLLFTSVPFVLGWLLIAYSGRAQAPSILFVGRFITGFSSGLISLSAPVYIAETADASKRGFLGSGFQLSVTVGILFTYITGKYASWQWLATISCIFPILLLIAMCLMPESPTWLIKNGRISEATDALLFLHGVEGASSFDVDISSPSIQTDGLQTEEGRERVNFAEFLKPHVHKPILVSLIVMFFQQFSGVNAIIFYTTDIFESTKSKAITPSDATIIVGGVQVVATFAACLLTDKAGRRILLIGSGIGCGLSLVLMSLYYFLSSARGEEFTSSYGFIPILALIIFIISFSLGMGPISWLIMGEILPVHVRGIASGLSSSFNWSCAFLVTKFFNNIISEIDQQGAYLLFSIICFLSCVFVFFFLPETKGKSMQEIENHFRGESYERFSY